MDFDELARSFAEPMPRRRVVRLLAGALVAGAVPRARPARVSGCAPNLSQCAGTGGKDIACCSPTDGCCIGGRDSIGNLQVACCPAGTTCCKSGIYPYCCGKDLTCGKKPQECLPRSVCKYQDPYVTSIEREDPYDAKTQCCTKRGVQPKDGDWSLAACEDTRKPRKGYKPTVNGCGSNGIKVPDTWRKASFLQACNTHDRCYGTCGADKSECDRKFRQDLLAACGKAYAAGTESHAQCAERAGTYYDAVSGSGYFGAALGSFAQAQREACTCC